jgi:hypothetical protein
MASNFIPIHAKKRVVVPSFCEAMPIQIFIISEGCKWIVFEIPHHAVIQVKETHAYSPTRCSQYVDCGRQLSEILAKIGS